MRFALLGDHPDGIAMARALAETGRHEIGALGFPSTASPRESFQSARCVGDVEEILADPSIEAVIVAGGIADRPALLRRALQSERHVLCVHPVDSSPDVAYEAALIQGDTGRVLFPLLPLALHPALIRFAEIVHNWTGQRFRLLQLERRSPQITCNDPGATAAKPSLPDWDVLRRIGGEIAEVSTFSVTDEFAPEDPLLLCGRFEAGGLFQATLLPSAQERHWRLTVVGDDKHAELLFEKGPCGSAVLICTDSGGTSQEERWEARNPWPALVAAFDAEVGLISAGVASIRPGWQDAVRALELDDAAHRSLSRRRASTLEYPEATEEVGFKGTMTLVGCGILWGILFLLILANWFPAAKWAVIPILLVFLALQLLRWIIPGARPGTDKAAR